MFVVFFRTYCRHPDRSIYQKPIVALLVLPVPPVPIPPILSPPILNLPDDFKPSPSKYATLMRYQGRLIDRIVGSIWWLASLFGAGNALLGIVNTVVGIVGCFWFKRMQRAGVAQN
jgi:hypothetical protein